MPTYFKHETNRKQEVKHKYKAAAYVDCYVIYF